MKLISPHATTRAVFQRVAINRRKPQYSYEYEYCNPYCIIMSYEDYGTGSALVLVLVQYE